jgi:kynurenine formamidase
MRRGMSVIFASVLTVAFLLAIGRQAGSRPQGQENPREEAVLRELANLTHHERSVVDMTYAISDKLPKWPGDERAFEAKVNATFEKDGYFTRSFWMLEHYGTHMDAPAHFPHGRATLDKLPIEHFFGMAAVIDVRDEVAKDSDYRLTMERVLQWEAAHGHIPPGSIALLRTGWASRWPDQVRYRNMDRNGVMHFPGYSVEAAKLLVARGVAGLGIDTLSVDYGPSKDFEVHRAILPLGAFNLENVANLDDLPESGAFIIAAPIKLEGGSGGAVRIFGILPWR